MNQHDIAILGAGIVGTCCALELIRQGKKVLLIDRDDPGKGTSYGNAGILSTGSIVPINNPEIWPQLPGILFQKHSGVRYKSSYLISNRNALVKYLSYGTFNKTRDRAIHLNRLISRSRSLHEQWLKQAGQSNLLHTRGWLRAYRTPKGFAAAQLELGLCDENNVAYNVMDIDAARELEPNLSDKYYKVVHMTNSAWVTNPHAVTQTYVNLFTQLGGEFLQAKIEDIDHLNPSWKLTGSGRQSIFAKQLVVALGPWSQQWLNSMGLKLPFIMENGGHREFALTPTSLSIPINDAESGFVVTPMENKARMTCGDYLANQISDVEHNIQVSAMLDNVENLARSTMSLGTRMSNKDWYGSRPAIADAMPAIGRAHLSELWVATAHQHIGLSTAPASGELLANLMLSDSNIKTSNPFDPLRFQK